MKRTSIVVPILGASVLAAGILWSGWRLNNRPARADHVASAASMPSAAPVREEFAAYELEPREDFRRSGHPFFDQLHFVEDDFEPLMSEEMVRRSALVVRGTIESISDGRVIDFARGPSHPMYTAVLKVSVTKVLSSSTNEGASHVYVEVVRAPFIEPSALNATKPSQEMTLFLIEAYTNEQVHTYTGGSVPPGETLYALTNPQGMLLETEEGLITQPLSQQPIFPPNVDTPEEVEEAVSGPRPLREERSP